MNWKEKARELKREVKVLYLAYHDPRVPWYARALAALVIAYALSPIDLIPDFTPILGYLDDLVLIPLGLALVVKLIPPPVLEEYRSRADAENLPVNWWAGAVIIALWAAIVIALVASSL